MKPRRYIAVIDPAMNRPELECLNQLATWSPHPLSYHLPKLLGTNTLARLTGTPAGIVIMGSAASVNDGFEWQKEMNAWLLPLMNAGVPTIGLCYGHQLICSLYGAQVSFMRPSKEKLRGVREVSLKKNELWGTETHGKLVVTHCEWVQNCPKDFEIVGTSQNVPVDAVAHKLLPIWGFQAHPEATPFFLQTLENGQVLSPEELELGHTIMKAFLARCAG